MTPPTLTDEQIARAWVSIKDPLGLNLSSKENTRDFAHAIANLRDQQWQEMLAKQEPVAMRYNFDGYGWLYIDSGSGSDWHSRHQDSEPLYPHPAPGQAAVMRQALEALESARRGEIGSGRIGAAIAALKQALGEQP